MWYVWSGTARQVLPGQQQHLTLVVQQQPGKEKLLHLLLLLLLLFLLLFLLFFLFLPQLTPVGPLFHPPPGSFLFPCSSSSTVYTFNLATF